MTSCSTGMGWFVCGDRLPHAGARGDRRWRDHGLLGRVPPGEARLAGCRAARAQAADLRLDLARRGPGRSAADQCQHHPAAHALGRALRPPRGRDRPDQRLEDERRAAPCLHRRPDDRAEASGHDRPQLRPRDAPPDAGRGEGPLAAHGCIRPGRRRLPADRRPGQSLGHRPGAGQRGPPGRRADHRGLCGQRLPQPRRPGCRRHHRPRRDRLRGPGALRRAMVESARSPRRRARAALPGPAPVSDHRADRGRDPWSADAARPRPPDLLQGRSGRPRDGRL